MMATILGPNGHAIAKVDMDAPEPAIRGDWAATLGTNNETKQPALLYICKVWKDGEETQIQVAVEAPPYTMIAQLLETIRKVESDALEQGYTLEPSEVAVVAQQVAQAGAKLVLQELNS